MTSSMPSSRPADQRQREERRRGRQPPDVPWELPVLGGSALSGRASRIGALCGSDPRPPPTTEEPRSDDRPRPARRPTRVPLPRSRSPSCSRVAILLAGGEPGRRPRSADGPPAPDAAGRPTAETSRLDAAARVTTVGPPPTLDRDPRQRRVLGRRAHARTRATSSAARAGPRPRSTWPARRAT